MRFIISSKIYGPSVVIGWRSVPSIFETDTNFAFFIYFTRSYIQKQPSWNICERSLVSYSCVRRWNRISSIILWPKKPNYIANSIPKVIFGYLIIWVLWWCTRFVSRSSKTRTVRVKISVDYRCLILVYWYNWFHMSSIFRRFAGLSIFQENIQTP